jgi:hypothetical protein
MTSDWSELTIKVNKFLEDNYDKVRGYDPNVISNQLDIKIDKFIDSLGEFNGISNELVNSVRGYTKFKLVDSMIKYLSTIAE